MNQGHAEIFSHMTTFSFWSMTVWDFLPSSLSYTFLKYLSTNVGSYINISRCFKGFFVPQQGKKFPVQILKKHKKDRNHRNKVVSFIHMEISRQGVKDRTERDLETGTSWLEKTHTEWWTDREGLRKGETQNSCFRKDTGYRKTKRKNKISLAFFFFFLTFGNKVVPILAFLSSDLPYLTIDLVKSKDTCATC